MRARSARLSEEGGWLIVEMMIGAVVLVLTALAIYSGLDGASKTSGRNRNRTVASYLAQQDQERMRTMDAAALSNYSVTRSVVVAGVTFKVTSTASFVNDNSGSVSCTNSSATAQYLKISSSVADPSGRNAPVQQDSLISPKPDDGNAVVQIVDRTGVTGVPGISTTLQESPGTTKVTDTNGCSLFTFLDNGTQYHVAFSQPTYVDVDGVNAVNGPITVVPGTVSTTQFQYDVAGTITASLRSATGGGAAVCAPLSVTDSHMHLNPPVRTFAATGCTSGTSAQVTATQLFPFTDKYAAYAGSCTANDPNKQWNQPAYFAPAPLTAGGSLAMTVVEPPIKLTVKKLSTGANWSGTRVFITDTSCAPNVSYPMFTTNAATSGSNIDIQGYPFAKYKICADDLGQSSNTDNVTVTNISNTTATGSSPTLTIDSSSNNGPCQ
jgi:hypothetical protein